MMLHKKKKVAIIGCGRIFDKHYKAIKNNKNLILVAVCDLNKRALEKISDKNITKYRNLNKMLSECDIDLLTICTPSGLHVKHAKIALRYKLNVLIEKPIDVNYSKAKKLVKEFNSKRKKLYLVKQNRFNQTILFLKKLIDNKKLGKINFIICNVLWSRPQEYYDSSKWRGDKKLDGGVVLNQSSHYIDLLIWLFGDIKKFQFMRKKLSRNIQSEDTAFLIIEFKNKIVANVSMTTLIPDSNIEGSIMVVGDIGMIKVGGQALNKIELSKNVTIPKNLSYKINDVYGFGHTKIYEEIYKDLINKDNFSIKGKEGLKSLKFITELYRYYKI